MMEHRAQMPYFMVTLASRRQQMPERMPTSTSRSCVRRCDCFKLNLEIQLQKPRACSSWHSTIYNTERYTRKRVGLISVRQQ